MTTSNIVSPVSDKDLQAFTAAVDHFASLLAAEFTPLKPEDIQRLAKPRRNAAAVVQTTAVLGQRYGLVSPSHPVERMLAKQQLVDTLRPVGERVAALHKLLQDIVLVSESDAWRGAMVTYGLLKSEARTNGVLRNALEPVRASMRQKYVAADGGTTVKRSRRAKGAPPPAAPDAPPPAPAKTGTGGS